MQRKNMFLIGVLVVGLCRAASENVLQLSQPALAYFNASLCYYEKIIKKSGFSTDTGLSGIFHGMYVDKAKKVSRDPSAQDVAKVIYAKMRNDAIINSLMPQLEEEASSESGIRLANAISALAQKDSVLASSQMGFTLQLPDGDLNDVFSQAPNVDLVKELFKRNADYPSTPEAIAVVRGSAIANCYFAQEQLQRRVRTYFADVTP
jgi:hypothetical protein